MTLDTSTVNVPDFATVTVIYPPSKLDQLLDLMASYFENRISREEWRERFALEHLVHHFDEPHGTIVLLIEGTLADADPPSGITPISKEECWERIWHICATAEAVFCADVSSRRFAKVTVHEIPGGGRVRQVDVSPARP